ncbi:hypothetical protein P0D88_41490 [Paraburkholderia sp. RL18-103-BIB-C]|uniref:hypothetical protein n=1 Tax=unclassified Paraburkholderia TaxID=2615204 RepID=UPI0038BD4699
MPASFRCPNCPKQIVLQTTPLEGQKLKCPVCHFEFKWSRARQLLAAYVPTVRRDSEPARREDVPAVRRDNAPARHDSLPARRPFVGLRRVVTAVKQDLAIPRSKDAAITLPGWFKQEHQFGEVVPMIDTTPDVAEIQVLTVHCSHFRRAATQTFARTRLGDPYRLVDNVDSQSFLHLASQNGVRISEGRKALRSLDEFFWGGWQCPLCHHGSIAGAAMDWFQCFCGEMSCGSSVVLTRGAAATCICGACGKPGVFNGGSVGSISGTKHISHRC